MNVNAILFIEFIFLATILWYANKRYIHRALNTPLPIKWATYKHAISSNGCLKVSTQGKHKLYITIEGDWSGKLGFAIENKGTIDAVYLIPSPSGTPVSSVSINGKFSLKHASFDTFVIYSSDFTGNASLAIEAR